MRSSKLTPSTTSFLHGLAANPRFRTIAACMVAVFAFSVILGPTPSAGAPPPVARAILFSSPTCAHCAMVREEVLPPLTARYGSKLQVAIISTASPNGQELFLAACLRYGLIRQSVPLLVIGDAALVGSQEIPEKFPGLIDKHLAAGGIDWPDIPGFRTMLASNTDSVAAPAAAGSRAAKQEPPTGKAAESVSLKPPAQTSTSAKKGDTSAAQKAAGPPAADASIAQIAAAQAATQRVSEFRVAASAPAVSAPAVSAPAPVASPLPVPQPDITDPAQSEGTLGGSASETTQAAVPSPETSGIIDLTGGEEASTGILWKIRRDPYGNGLAIMVLIAMVLVLLASPRIAGRPEAAARSAAVVSEAVRKPRYDWLIPILIVAGLGVAGYLSHVEVREVEAVCGPVGDCNTVQQSKYARLFGILPIGVLGLAGYLAMLSAWVVRRKGRREASIQAAVAMLGMAAFGMAFSIYLTFLEPFVIGATCLWCLSSAVLMTLMYVLSLKPGISALRALRQPKHRKKKASGPR